MISATSADTSQPAPPLDDILVALRAGGLHVGISERLRLEQALALTGPWTVLQLREALRCLLVTDPLQNLVFERVFTEHFHLGVAAESEGPDVAGPAPVPEPQALGEEEYQSQELAHAPDRRQNSVRKPRASRLIPLGAVVAIFAGAAGIWWVLGTDVPDPGATGEGYHLAAEKGSGPPSLRSAAGPSPEPAQESTPPMTSPEANAKPPEAGLVWRWYCWVVAAWPALILLGGPVSAVLWCVRRKQRRLVLPSVDTPAVTDQGPPVYVPSIKPGLARPWLSVSAVAEALGARLATERDPVVTGLDLEASIRATCRQGGIPHLVPGTDRGRERVLILIDHASDSLSWNPIARELVAALDMIGIDVTLGQFRHIPDAYRAEDGTWTWLDEYDASRPLGLTLVFGEARTLLGPRRELTDRARRTLQQLAGLGRVAWIDPRDPARFDLCTFTIADYLPVFPGTAEGVLAALQGLDEHAAGELCIGIQRRWIEPPIPPVIGTDPADIEFALGDALPWAAACAMSMPMPIPWAFALRDRLFPGIPPIRLDRLLLAAGHRRDPRGFTFDERVLAVLDREISVRLGARLKRRVLQEILRLLIHHRPPPTHLAAREGWLWRYTKVVLRYRPKKAIRLIERLRGGALAPLVREDFMRMERMVAPGEDLCEDLDPHGDLDKRDWETLRRAGLPVSEPTEVTAAAGSGRHSRRTLVLGASLVSAILGGVLWLVGTLESPEEMVPTAALVVSADDDPEAVADQQESSQEGARREPTGQDKLTMENSYTSDTVTVVRLSYTDKDYLPRTTQDSIGPVDNAQKQEVNGDTIACGYSYLITSEFNAAGEAGVSFMPGARYSCNGDMGILEGNAPPVEHDTWHVSGSQLDAAFRVEEKQEAGGIKRVKRWLVPTSMKMVCMRDEGWARDRIGGDYYGGEYVGIEWCYYRLSESASQLAQTDSNKLRTAKQVCGENGGSAQHRTNEWAKPWLPSGLDQILQPVISACRDRSSTPSDASHPPSANGIPPSHVPPPADPSSPEVTP